MTLHPVPPPPKPDPSKPTNALVPASPTANALSTKLVSAARQEIAALVQTGLITTDQQRSLTIATENAGVMAKVATAPEARHFKRIDTLMAIRTPTPVSQARDTLVALNDAWQSVSADFHHYKKRFFQAQVLRAKLAKKVEQVKAMEEGHDRMIAEAEAQLEAAEIEEIEAELARGQEKVKNAVAIAAKQSESYALICKQAGKEAFTEEDFRHEEFTYLIKAAWWHACQVFVLKDVRDKWTHRKEGGDIDWFASGEEDAQEREAAQRRKAEANSRISLPSDVYAYFTGLGITRKEVEDEINKLRADRDGFEMINGNRPQSYEERYDQWVVRMGEKYKQRAIAAVEQFGIERLRRIMTLIAPTDGDKGTKRGKDMDRTGVME